MSSGASFSCHHLQIITIFVFPSVDFLMVGTFSTSSNFKSNQAKPIILSKSNFILETCFKIHIQNILIIIRLTIKKYFTNELLDFLDCTNHF